MRYWCITWDYFQVIYNILYREVCRHFEDLKLYMIRNETSGKDNLMDQFKMENINIM